MFKKSTQHKVPEGMVLVPAGEFIGSFEVIQEYQNCKAKFLESPMFDLKLNDGHHGTIVISKLHTGSHQRLVVDFKTSGPFER